MKIQIKKYFIYGFVPLVMLLLMSFSGGGKSDGKEKDGGGGGGCQISEKNTTISLYSFYNTPPGRNSGSGAQVPANPSLWTGAPSANSLFGNSQQYYCVITVTTDCNGYSKEYVWNPNQSGGTTMTIPVPNNRTFRVNVEYWEQCGPYWGSNSSPSYKRGLWFSEKTQGYTTIISINNWLFLRAESC